MIPTPQWMQKNFALFNQKYFGNVLIPPKFIVTNLNNMWGYYKFNGEYNVLTRNVTNIPNPGIIYLTNKYSREEKNVQNTLLHEMVHVYIYTILKKYPLQQHGNYFKRIANKLNALGWNISERNDLTDTDIYQINEEVIQRMVTECVMKVLNNKSVD
jgi:hypothetical protein